MKSMEFVGGVVLIAYQDNGKGLNQDDGFTQDESDITKATIFAKLKPQATVTRAEILDLFIKCVLTLGEYNEHKVALVKASKSIEGAVFTAVYEGYFYEMRKLSSRTNKVPLRFSKLTQIDSTLVSQAGPGSLPTARVGAFCLGCLQEFSGTKLRVKIVGKPYKFGWGKRSSRVKYTDPINGNEVLDEPIGS